MANDQDNPIIVKALEKINRTFAEVLSLKMFVNQADRLEGRPPRFPDAEDSTLEGFVVSASAPVASSKKWQPGDFFNVSLSGAARRILEARKVQAGAPSPASVDEIHEGLCQGSFDFGANGMEAQKNSIRISLGKNSATFVKLPNTDLFGLAEWYGARKKGGRKGANDKVDADDGVSDEDQGATPDQIREAMNLPGHVKIVGEE